MLLQCILLPFWEACSLTFLLKWLTGKKFPTFSSWAQEKKRWSSSSHVSILPIQVLSSARILDISAWYRQIRYGTYLDHELGRFVILRQHYLGEINPDQTTSGLSSLKQHRLLSLPLKEREKPQTLIKSTRKTFHEAHMEPNH